MENDNPTPAAPEFVPGIGNAPQPAPEQPVEQPAEQPAQPAEQPTPAAPENPTEQPAAPEAEQPQKPEEKPLDYDAYLDSLINDAVQGEIKMPEIPTNETLQSDEKALTKFFEDLVDTAAQKSKAEVTREQVIRDAERKAWDETFVKYPELKDSKELRDTIHTLRIGAYQRGQALSPIQVADKYIGDIRNAYKRAVNDTNVQTTVRDSQPIGGGTQAPKAQGVDYASLHHGGDAAAVNELTKLIEQGRI